MIIKLVIICLIPFCSCVKNYLDGCESSAVMSSVKENAMNAYGPLLMCDGILMNVEPYTGYINTRRQVGNYWCGPLYAQVLIQTIIIIQAPNVGRNYSKAGRNIFIKIGIAPTDLWTDPAEYILEYGTPCVDLLSWTGTYRCPNGGILGDYICFQQDINDYRLKGFTELFAYVQYPIQFTGVESYSITSEDPLNPVGNIFNQVFFMNYQQTLSQGGTASLDTSGSATITITLRA